MAKFHFIHQHTLQCLSYRRIFSLFKIRFSFNDYLFTGAISLSGEDFLEVCEQVIAAKGQI